MRRRAGLLALLALAACAAGPRTLPPEVRARAGELEAQCRARGLPSSRPSKEHVVATEFNDDGRPDYILHPSAFTCAGEAASFAAAGNPCAGDEVAVSQPDGYAIVAAGGCAEASGPRPARLNVLVRTVDAAAGCTAYACSFLYEWVGDRFVRLGACVGEDARPCARLDPRMGGTARELRPRR